MTILDHLMDFIYPRNITCVLCHEESEDELCYVCKGSIQFNIGKVCQICGRMIKGDYDVCKNCMALERHFDYGTSAVIYDDYVKRLVYNLKYHNKKYIAHTMARYMLDRIVDLDLDIDFDGIIPVPLHKERLNKRGFNQTFLISKFLSELTGLPIVESLTRVKATPPLNQLSSDERREVLKDAFCCNEKLNGNYILVDDVFTTGSTVNMCSKLLKESGVSYILVATFAVGE